MFIIIIGFFIGGILISGTCNMLLLQFSESLGIRNKNDVVIRWSNQSKPSLGGVSFFTTFFFGVIAFAVLFSSENIFQNKQFVGLLASGILAFGMGLSDDAYNTKPLFKLFVQILCGLILVLTNTSIHLFNNSIVDASCTIIWVVAMMNSLNMLDNMDGITGTTVLFILLSCLASDCILLYDWNMNIWTLTLTAQIGALVGFLKFNIHPSKLFMGDAGSQFIGLFAAFYSMHNLWNVGETTNISPIAGAFIVLIAFTPAIADTLTVVINRIRKGQSPMVGGKDHTTHHLVYAGFKDKQVWYIFVGISFLSTVIAALAIVGAKLGNPWIAVILSSYFFIVFGVLFWNTQRKQH